MKPQEVAKLSQNQKGDEICLRAVSLLKTIINVSWDRPNSNNDPSLDKENVSQNQEN
jgi:hypothetical protein